MRIIVLKRRSVGMSTLCSQMLLLALFGCSVTRTELDVATQRPKAEIRAPFGYAIAPDGTVYAPPAFYDAATTVALGVVDRAPAIAGKVVDRIGAQMQMETVSSASRSPPGSGQER